MIQAPNPHNFQECNAIKCTEKVRKNAFMCNAHWFKLPDRLRALMFKASRGRSINSELPKEVTKEYCIAASKCIRYIAQDEGITLAGDEPKLVFYEHREFTKKPMR